MGMHHLPATHRALYGLVQVHARIVERVGAEMEARSGVPLSWFEALLHLEEPGRLRMSELADALLLSRGGVTRMIARMEEEGLVERETPREDRRATYAVITEAGRAAIARAMPVHLEAAESAFGRHLDEEETGTLLRTFARVLEANGTPCEALLDEPAQAPAATLEA